MISPARWTPGLDSVNRSRKLMKVSPRRVHPVKGWTSRRHGLVMARRGETGSRSLDVPVDRWEDLVEVGRSRLQVGGAPPHLRGRDGPERLGERARLARTLLLASITVMDRWSPHLPFVVADRAGLLPDLVRC